MTKATVTKIRKLAETLDSEELMGIATMLLFKAADGQDPMPLFNAFHEALLETWAQMTDGTLTSH